MDKPQDINNVRTRVEDLDRTFMITNIDIEKPGSLYELCKTMNVIPSRVSWGNGEHKYDKHRIDFLGEPSYLKLQQAQDSYKTIRDNTDITIEARYPTFYERVKFRVFGNY